MAQPAKPVSIAPLLAVNFVGTLGFSIVTPFLVVLVTNWGGNAVIYGVLAATYSFFQLFGAPILGQLSDRVGRRRVLLLSQFGTLLSWGVFLIAFALPANTLLNVSNRWLGDFVITLPLLVLFVARAADGLTGGNVSVSNAYLADITTEDQRSRNFGRMAVSSNLGYIVGPALAGLLGATLLGELYQRPPDLTQGDSHERRDLIQWHQGKGGFDGSKDYAQRQVRRRASPGSGAVPGWESGATDVGDCPGSGWG